jgi:hypothetical protein
MVAHHQIWFVRIVATALDILTALFVERIANRLFSDGWGNWIAAIWCFAALTVRDSGGALMSETVALPFLMAGALLLCDSKPTLSAAL